MLMQPGTDQDSNANWAFRNEDEAYGEPSSDAPETQIEPVSWTASEFIAHHKDPVWYGTLVGAVLTLCVAIYFVTKDVISIIAIVVVAILFLIASAKKPEQRLYMVDLQGISIGQKFYPYGMFKSFALRQEGAIGTITFMPLQRLMPEISIYFAPEDEDSIVDVLASSLPNDQRAERSTDRLMKRLRF